MQSAVGFPDSDDAVGEALGAVEEAVGSLVAPSKGESGPGCPMLNDAERGQAERQVRI